MNLVDGDVERERCLFALVECDWHDECLTNVEAIVGSEQEVEHARLEPPTRLSGARHGPKCGLHRCGVGLVFDGDRANVEVDVDVDSADCNHGVETHPGKLFLGGAVHLGDAKVCDCHSRSATEDHVAELVERG